jgi:two-component system sensor histidine kinase VicK
MIWPAPLNMLQSLAGSCSDKVKPYDNKELDQLIEIMVDSCKRNVKLIREFVANEFLESSEVVLEQAADQYYGTPQASN